MSSANSSVQSGTCCLVKGPTLRRLGLILFLVCVMPFAANPAFAIPVARLQLWSDPGDPIGEGGTYDIVYDPDLGASVSSGVWEPSRAWNQEGVEVYLDSAAGSYSRISLSSPTRGVRLEAGYYPDAQEWGFEEPGHPGLDFVFRSTGAWRPTGEFTVHEITYATDGGSLTSLVVDFIQRDQGTAIRGRLDFNVHGLTAIPEPSTAVLIFLGLVGLNAQRRLPRRVDSFLEAGSGACRSGHSGDPALDDGRSQ